jgi:hypothetical protein
MFGIGTTLAVGALIAGRLFRRRDQLVVDAGASKITNDASSGKSDDPDEQV